MNERFSISPKLRMLSLVLTGIGALTLIIGGVVLLGSSDVNSKIRFWEALLHNSIFFLLVTVACSFILAASSLAQGGWIVAYRRIPEAIGANTWLFGLIATVIMFLVAFTFRVHTPEGDINPIYRWMTPGDDKILLGKKGFLNPTFFSVFTICAIGAWSFLGLKFRRLSANQDSAGKSATKNYWSTVFFSAIFMVIYALTQMSAGPWMWIMSIDAHWFSTMFSWYVWASAFVTGMAFILMWVVYLKNQGYLAVVNKEHIHDLGKFMFAFSIFWTYVWFAQYMLIWYGNIPEETTYFKIRMEGPYRLMWFGVFVISFVMPILILMSRPSKRNFFTAIFMAMFLIFGHWLDFYQMVYPGPMGANWSLSWYEIGIVCGFVGIHMLSVSKSLSKYPLVPKNHPFLKESILHVS